MNIIDVIPVSRGIHKDTLSYFTGGDAPTGAIVRVPLRGRTVHALVVGTRSVEASKQELRQSSFAFKKASSIVSSGFLSPAFLSAAKRTADFHIATLGSVLFSLVPKIALENVENLSYTKPPEREPKELHGAILQADDEERFSHYRSLVREEFARGRSVFLCMPTTGDVKRAEKLLEKGIGEYSYIFHGQTKKKDLIKKWNSLSEEKHPVFIIGTPQF